MPNTTTIPHPEGLLGTADVARALGKSQRTVQELIQRGHLPAYDFGTRSKPDYRVSPSALRMFKERRRVKAQ